MGVFDRIREYEAKRGPEPREEPRNVAEEIINVPWWDTDQDDDE